MHIRSHFTAAQRFLCVCMCVKVHLHLLRHWLPCNECAATYIEYVWNVYVVKGFEFEVCVCVCCTVFWHSTYALWICILVQRHPMVVFTFTRKFA